MNNDPTQAWLDHKERAKRRAIDRRDISARIMAGLLSNPEFLARGVGAAIPDEKTREAFDQIAVVAVMATDALLDALAAREKDDG